MRPCHQKASQNPSGDWARASVVAARSSTAAWRRASATRAPRRPARSPRCARRTSCCLDRRAALLRARGDREVGAKPPRRRPSSAGASRSRTRAPPRTRGRRRGGARRNAGRSPWSRRRRGGAGEAPAAAGVLARHQPGAGAVERAGLRAAAREARADIGRHPLRADHLVAVEGEAEAEIEPATVRPLHAREEARGALSGVPKPRGARQQPGS